MEKYHHFAGIKPRMAATAIDFLIIATYACVLFFVGWPLRLSTSVEQRMESAITRDLVAFITLILPVVLYFSLMESSTKQATIGKHKMGLQVINANGGKLSSGQSFLRSGLKFVPWQIAHTAFFQLSAGNTSRIWLSVSILVQGWVIINLLMLMIDKQHRTLYDRLVGTFVVYKR